MNLRPSPIAVLRVNHIWACGLDMGADMGQGDVWLLVTSAHCLNIDLKALVGANDFYYQVSALLLIPSDKQIAIGSIQLHVDVVIPVVFFLDFLYNACDRLARLEHVEPCGVVDSGQRIAGSATAGF